MNIDKITTPSFLNIVFKNDKDVLKALKTIAKNNAREEDDLAITSEYGNPYTEEFYFDESDSSIHYCGSIEQNEKPIWVSFSIKLSDGILIDILAHSIKKFNKLKSVLESLK